ncbi:hypothetical protein D3C78_991580 [compost metagenome]
MFEMVIGQLDVILERFEKNSSLEKNLEKSIYKIILESATDEEIASKVDSLGQSLSSIQSELTQEQDLREGESDLKQILGG